MGNLTVPPVPLKCSDPHSRWKTLWNITCSGGRFGGFLGLVETRPGITKGVTEESDQVKSDNSVDQNVKTYPESLRSNPLPRMMDCFGELLQVIEGLLCHSSMALLNYTPCAESLFN